MRMILSVFIVLFYFFLHAVYAEEFIDGRVVSLDRGNEQIIVEIDSGLEEKEKEDSSLKTSTQADDSKTLPLITVSTVNSNFPHYLEPGKFVRIWGDFDRATGKITAIRLSRVKLRSGIPDDTGVRRRLKRCGKHKHGRSKHHGGH